MNSRLTLTDRSELYIALGEVSAALDPNIATNMSVQGALQILSDVRARLANMDLADEGAERKALSARLSVEMEAVPYDDEGAEYPVVYLDGRELDTWG